MAMLNRALDAMHLPSPEKMRNRAVAMLLPVLDMLRHNWHLGMTCFGGPAVNFQQFRVRFVEKLAWIDEQTYNEQFALCQAISGPGSTKMIYTINMVHYNFWIGALSFLVWTLPGAIAAYALSEGIANVGKELPDPVYALLTGVNSATVGVIILGAVQLSRQAVTDKLSRILVFLGASAGLLYNALWYWPVLLASGCLIALVWDSHVLQNSWRRFKRRNVAATPDPITEESGVEMTRLDGPSVAREAPQSTATGVTDPSKNMSGTVTENAANRTQTGELNPLSDPEEANTSFLYSWKSGVAIWVGYFIVFIIVMVLRRLESGQSRGFDVFANLLLAGTIIFGGGPVVIPLLREYVVAEGWVSPRDFLLGLGIIQAFPGPNFNFAVYLASLAMSSTSTPRPVGALIGLVAMFFPGLILHTGAMGFWRAIRRYHHVRSGLRGIQATAVGLIYTAVYRLFMIGYLDEQHTTGSPLGREPWWIVVIATSFTGGMWFDVSAPVAILIGGIMGLVWYGIVG